MKGKDLKNRLKQIIARKPEKSGGTTITITVGSGGNNPPISQSQGRNGGDGAQGVAFITFNGSTTTYTAGTHTQTLS